MSTCPRCGATFECGMVDDKTAEACWCTRLPPLPASSRQTAEGQRINPACFCPACLRTLTDSPGASLLGKR